MADPCVALNFPATHCVHVPPSGPVDPLLHVQSDKDELPGGEFEFVGHEPLQATPYLPAPQTVQDDSAVCPVALPYLPTAQALQDVSAVCPVAFPYLPVSQSVQLSLTSRALYLPATHAAHVSERASPP